MFHLKDIIVPRWAEANSQKHPFKFEESEINCSEYDLINNDIPNVLKDKMKAIFGKYGVVVLRNTKMDEGHIDKAYNLINVIVNKTFQYKGGANSRSGQADFSNVYDTGAPKEAYLHYHHEMAYVSQSIAKIAFFCTRAVQRKGHTYISEGRLATEYLLKTELGKKLKEKGVCYIRYLTDKEYYKGKSEDEVYNHWQTSFSVTNPNDAEKIALEQGLEFEWGPDRLLKTKRYTSAFEYCPDIDQNLLYCSIADHHMWFDTWPGIMSVDPEKRPIKMTFGDDTEFTHEELKEFVEVYDKFGIPIKWEKGDIAIINNYIYAHGRPAYSLKDNEERNLYVILGDPYTRTQEKKDKW